MARCFDAGYGGDISSGFIRDVWSVTAPQGDLDAVVDALVALDYGQGQRASAYLGTPCLWPRCRERMDDLLRSRAGKPGQAVCADVVEWVRRWHDQGERVASPLSAGGGERPGGKGSPSCVPIVGAGGRDTSGNSGETREGDH